MALTQQILGILKVTRPTSATLVNRRPCFVAYVVKGRSSSRPGITAHWPVRSAVIRPLLVPSLTIQSADNFMCNTCTARREKPPPVDKQKQHRYTHALVRCSRKIEEDHVTTTRSAEDRMSTLEDTVWLLAGKVERMEATLSRLERLLLSSLANGQTFTLVEA